MNAINKSSNKYIPDYLWDLDVSKLYQYLDTLTLQQEGALFNIIILLTIFFTLFSILGIFFGNEIIKYFKLENKYTWLSKFLLIRAKFQRYYLMWNILVLFFLCILGLGINLLAFILG